MDPPTSAPFTAFVGLACYNCHKLEELPSIGDGAEPLLRCGGCHRLWYCSGGRRFLSLNPTPLTLFAHWGQHKALCKAFQFLEKDTEATGDLITSFLSTLDRISVSHKTRMMNLCEKVLGRSLKNREFDILSYEPRCLACARTDIILRSEARLSEPKATISALMPCPRCKMAFYCCEDHRNAARPLHESTCNDLPCGVSQCEMNRQIRVDAEFRTVMTPPQARRFMWRFIPRQSTDVKRSSVGTAFAAHTPACIRLVSSLASTVVTVLCALEQLNTNTAWTTKSSLTIHMLGSPPDFDPSIAYMYEAILHRVPGVQILNILFCGPAVAGIVSPPPGARSVLRENCYPKGGTIFHHYVTSRNYEDYVRSEGAAFEPPDLCIATNSFIATNDPARWRSTIKMLVARGIPSVFTAYERRIAERDLVLLRESGANLVPSLSLAKNPWGSLLLDPNFDKVHGFHAPNTWFTGAFR
ncbi:hypothetical protein B0H10DRAFT_2098727 [Mycena sp. CBHHK59/15]|nr:hypothetical protein B0H10DRAFT_2098727 [Mycena sp. CBHHK59/15]